jgi:dihydrolipoamide dehydrogenase
VNEVASDVVVLGGGPGGYTAAIRAGQLGLDTVLIEAHRPGGTCLTVGCIPSKAMLYAAQEYALVAETAAATDGRRGIRLDGVPTINLAETVGWKEQLVDGLTAGVEHLLERAGVRLVRGWGTLVDGKTLSVTRANDSNPQIIRAQRVVLATGSRPKDVPGLPVGGRVVSSTEALALKHLPRSMVIIGGGYIGLELGTVFAKFGSRVTIIEMAAQLLPGLDADLVRPVVESLTRRGVEILTSARLEAFDEDSGMMTVSVGSQSVGLDADVVLVAAGREPASEGWGLDGLDLDRDGPFVVVDDQCRTSMRDVFAIGDLTPGPLLAHRAIAQGQLVAEVLAGYSRAWRHRCVPAVVYTDPEVVTVGMTVLEARESGIGVLVGDFPFLASGRARLEDDTSGLVRIVARADNHVVLGVHAVGHNVSELTPSMTLAIEMCARLEDIAGTIHAHPTRGEAFQEAALIAMGLGLHA